jgi:hypothetical protein
MRRKREDPRLPCPHPRGSAERIACYRERARLELPLYVEGDSQDMLPLLDHGQSFRSKAPGIHQCRSAADYV